MKHRVSGRKLGRTKDQRKALFRNLITDLFRYERIKTTEAKAKAVRSEAEKLITTAKRGDQQARRRVERLIKDEEVINYLFDVLAPDFADRPGGYTRIVKIGPRKGDGAPMVLLELV